MWFVKTEIDGAAGVTAAGLVSAKLGAAASHNKLIEVSKMFRDLFKFISLSSSFLGLIFFIYSAALAGSSRNATNFNSKYLSPARSTASPYPPTKSAPGETLICSRH